MGMVRAQLAVSLDGFVAGPRQSEQEPLGVGGERLHEFMFPTEAWREHHGMAGGEQSPSSAVLERVLAGIGAGVMGRNMFGPIRGPWEGDWRGWWGDDPPYHHPVFVLTHHPREPLEMAGGTTFTFVTDGLAAAIEQAQAAAGDQDVALHGGGSTVQQAIGAGLLDELVLHVVPVLLGDGVRLLDDLPQPPPELEQVDVVAAPGVAHLTYRMRG